MKLPFDKIDDFLIGVLSSFSKTTQDKLNGNLNLKNDLKRILENKTIEELEQLDNENYDKYYRAIINRVLITHFAIEAATNNIGLELKKIWKLIFDSLRYLDEEDVISSIGSQGFLAIPLFRIEKENGEFYLLRLHIWDSDLDIHINKETTDNLSIHTHQFHANSWILAGEIYNTRYHVEESVSPTEFNLFKIEWNKSENKLVKKSSTAKNTGRFMDVKILAEEIYKPKEFYEIKANSYHKSIARKGDKTDSTLFLFSSIKNRVKESKVLGPSQISESKINRKVMIDPKTYLDRIQSQMNNYD